MSIRKEKIDFFEKRIFDFFSKAGRERLPWRKKGVTAYEVWVSEIMLQQTQVSRVIGYYEKFLDRFPNVETLSGTSFEEFLPYYQGLGYYSRGRNMLKTAEIITMQHQGIFPKEVSKLQTLPGVGPYTAAAIASFAYGEEVLAWDTNLRRVVGRFFYGAKNADIPVKKFNDFFSVKAKIMNAALMDFGSAICVARPKCGICPLASRCVYFSQGGKQEERAKAAKESMYGGIGQKIDYREARVLLFLHENHKKYYSSSEASYEPFIVPSSHNTRAGIKSWFRVKYGLELSVRPPYKKSRVKGSPTLFVRAQILMGEAAFQTFSPAEAKTWEAAHED